MKKNILLIGYGNASNRRIKSEVEKTGKGVKCYIVPPDDFQIYISNINKRDEIYLRGERVYANGVHAIIPRIGKNLEYGCTVVKHLNENLKIPSTSNSDGLQIAANKLTSGQLMSQSGVILPKTMYLQSDKNINFIIEKLGGLGDGKKLVAKLVYGSQGSAVMILESLLGASTVLSTFMKIKKSVLLQQFISTASEDERSWDIRAFVVNGKVVSAIKRFALDGDFRSNVSISKTAEKVTLTDEQKDIAIRAASSINLTGVNGVDLAISKDDDKTYVIECNGNPSLKGITKYGGVNVAKKIAEYSMKISKSVAYNIPELISGTMKRTFGGSEKMYSSEDYTNIDKIRRILDRDEITGITEEELNNNTDIAEDEYCHLMSSEYIEYFNRYSLDNYDSAFENINDSTNYKPSIRESSKEENYTVHQEKDYYNNPINRVVYAEKVEPSNAMKSNPLNKLAYSEKVEPSDAMKSNPLNRVTYAEKEKPSDMMKSNPLNKVTYAEKGKATEMIKRNPLNKLLARRKN